MLIMELFDRPSQIQKTKDTEDAVRYVGVVGGDQLVVDFEQIHDSSSWGMQFSVGGRQDVRGDKEGEEIAIFSTVIKAIKEFVSDRQPSEFVFTAAKKEVGQDTDRAKLYDRLVRRFANSAGYTYTVSDRNNRIVFSLKKMQD